MTRIELAQKMLDTYHNEQDTHTGNYWAGYLSVALANLLSELGSEQ